MDNSLMDAVRSYTVRKRSRKAFRQLVRIMGCIVAFVTTYALILPAITMEKKTFCGFEEHTHSESCYILETQSRTLVCSGSDFDLHVHGSGCYDAEGRVQCGQADYLVHKHDATCRNDRGELVCTLPERSQHVHGSNCYVTPDPVPHVHTDACKTAVRGELICTEEVREGHQHGAACYEPGTQLLCTKPAGHQHNDACYINPLICTISTAPHVHTGDCYTLGAVICGITENHVHQGECFDSRLTCDVQDENHNHTPECYTTETVCTVPEGHFHTEDCHEKNLICGRSDGEVHNHGDGCYSQEQKLNCNLEENHTHESACFQLELTCEIPESQGHAHEDACYAWNTEYVCGLEEGQLVEQEPVLVCTEPAAQVHGHNDGCFELHTVAADPICGEAHEHTFRCYECSCTLEEHSHSPQCLADPTADVESYQTWEATMKDVEFTGDWNLDVVAIAESQLGYQESEANFVVWEDGSRHGYTRYGDWYGSKHGDWCGMFASFCLHYGGVKGVPHNYGVRPWIKDLSKPELDLYRTAEEYVPIPGDLVFFDWDKQDGLSDHVGIVYEIIEATETEKAKLKTIEGNSSNCVQFRTYDLDSPVLLGYSMLPENPEKEYNCGLHKHVHNKRDCYDEEENLICEETPHVHNEECVEELPVYYCGLEEHVHEDACYDAEGNEICEKTAHEHTEDCLTEPEPEPVYYCGLEEHVHEDTCYDAEGNEICEKTAHEHTEDCLTEPEPEPVYYCGLEEHVHEDACYDAEGNEICEKTAHEHTEDCLTEPEPEPVYYCGLEEHVHEDACYDAEGNEICEKTAHEHIEDCLTEPEPEPVYYCGLEEHVHEDACYDAEGNEICEKTAHEHTEDCLTEPDSVYYCGLEVHAHSESCLDETGKLACGQDEHEHDDACLIRYYCGKVVHVHDEAVCFDADGTLICEKQVHEHLASCLTEPKYYCGKEVHTHDPAVCYDAEGKLICEQEEHTHEERCTWIPMMAPQKVTYYCGQEEHIHSDACKDVVGGIICGLAEHAHTSLCLADLSDLTEADRMRVEEIIRLIDEIPSDEELLAKAEELALAGDEDAEIQWMTETYRKIEDTYRLYHNLPETLQSRVVNAEKLLALDFVWSRMTLVPVTIWLDGTNGGQISLTGAACDTLEGSYSTGDTVSLPTTWKGPDKYNYIIRGWYDVYNREYYEAGAQLELKAEMGENLLFYADWKAATYDIGQKDENHIVDTVSTKDFITTHIFDYSGIFNMQSVEMKNRNWQNPGDKQWEIIPKGEPLSNGKPSLGIILRDWDNASEQCISHPANDGQRGQEHNNSWEPYNIWPGLYGKNAYNMYDLFFDPDSSYLGKECLGTADHLFQYNSATGYYFYDSAENAASYNRSNQRFYVYDYLEQTTISDSSSADFLPFNSPYASANPTGYSPLDGGTIRGKTVYEYDALAGNNKQTGANFWFGMTMEIEFFLPDKPGETGANRSTHDTDMVFRFSGDDDVYVLVDGKLVLDIGGLHTKKSGEINFSTGTATVEGSENLTYTNAKVNNRADTLTAQVAFSDVIRNLNPGNHKLTLCYMERGSSMSNCSIEFNLSPRYNLEIQKQDLISKDALNGAEFKIYLDEACSQLAPLWSSYDAYRNNESTVESLVVSEENNSVWGLIPEKTYYIKEVQPPPGYPETDGVIQMHVNMTGAPAIKILNNTTAGFTAQIVANDMETQTIELSVTNNMYTDETTQVYVKKHWAGGRSEPVTVHLLADGKWVRDVVLSADNNWEYTWTNLPAKKIVTEPDVNGGESVQKEVPVEYTVKEDTVPGFAGKVEAITSRTESTLDWVQLSSGSGFEAGRMYLIRTSKGYLEASGGKLSWVDEATAKLSQSAHWEAVAVNGDQVELKNEAGYWLASKYISSNAKDRYFYAATDQQTVSYSNDSFYFTYSNWYYSSTYYLSGTDPNEHGHIYARGSGEAVKVTLFERSGVETQVPLEGYGYQITNVPQTEEKLTDVKIAKTWSDRNGEALADDSQYRDLSVRMKLLSRVLDSVLPENTDPYADLTQFTDTGHTAVLNRYNQWSYTFENLPAFDADENRIIYTLVEEPVLEEWTADAAVVTQDDNQNFVIAINNRFSHKLSVPVQKVWDSQILNFERPEVELRLYSVSRETGEVSDMLDSVRLSDTNDWKASFEVVPPEEANVEYYLYEPAKGFAPVYEHTDRILIDGVMQSVGRIVFDDTTGEAVPSIVTNYVMSELPQTGGPGTNPYTAGGLLLSLAALLLLYNKIHKRRRGAM